MAPIHDEVTGFGLPALQDLPKGTVFRFRTGISWFKVTDKGRTFVSVDTGKEYHMFHSAFPERVMVRE